MNELLLAMQFLTRLPTPHTLTINATALGKSVLFFPLVGLIIGLILYITAAFLSFANPWLLAAMLLTLWVGLSGALHLDGLADSADAFVGGQGQRERCLEIMKDPYAGPAGVSSIVLILILKFAALGSLLATSGNNNWWLAPVIGRSAIIYLLIALPYVREQGLGSPMSEHLPRIRAKQVLLAVAVVVILGAGWNGLLALIATALLLIALQYALRRNLGGTTGDTLGAGVELTETLVLVVFALSATDQF